MSPYFQRQKHINERLCELLGMENRKPMSLHQIADYTGLTTQAISFIERRAIRKLKRKLKLEDFIL